jgi:hypothetical protein
MCRDSRGDKVLCLVVKYWPRIVQIYTEKLVIGCHEWQIKDLKLEVGQGN